MPANAANCLGAFSSLFLTPSAYGNVLTQHAIVTELPHPAIWPGKPFPPAWNERHVDEQHTNRTSKHLNSASPCSTSAGAAQPAPSCNGADFCLDLSSLPAPAIDAIFHQMDCISGLNLACTCRAYATAFALQKPGFVQKCIAELVPILSLDRAIETGPNDYQGSQAYGRSDFNPVSIHVWWSSAMAIRRIYALRHDASVLEQFWRQAWPADVWSELLKNGLSAGAHHVLIHVKILIESQTELVLPWEWLYGPFTRTPYTMLDLMLAHRPSIQVGVSLHRPAHGGRYQEVMLTHFVRNYGEQWELEFETFSRNPDYAYLGDPDVILLCDGQQRVAVTGRWCDRLPKAETSLWRAQQGCTLFPDCMTDGDLFYEADKGVLSRHNTDISTASTACSLSSDVHDEELTR